MEKFELSEADREFIRNQQAASRRRRLQALKANAAAVPIVILVSGSLSAFIFWLVGSWALAAIAGLPGLALAWEAYRRLHPDYRGR